MSAISISVTDVTRSFKRVNIHKAVGPDGIPGRVLRACAFQLAGVFTDIFNLSLSLSVIPASKNPPLCHTKEKENHMLEWLEARCSDTHLQQVFWETHQRLHLLCAACLTGSAAICISQQPFHRRCYCLHPAYCSLPPGKQERLCEDAVCGLQLRIQYHSACHTGCEAPDSRTKQISVQLDPGLSDRQKSGGQNGQQHFISADP